MEINQVSKMLAFSYVSELIKQKKITKRSFVDINGASEDTEEEFETTPVDSANMSFGDLENYYKNVVTAIENTPEIRGALITALKNFQNDGGDLNSLYPADIIAKETSFQRVLFMND
jgi:hypothetical protein